MGTYVEPRKVDDAWLEDKANAAVELGRSMSDTYFWLRSHHRIQLSDKRWRRIWIAAGGTVERSWNAQASD